MSELQGVEHPTVAALGAGGPAMADGEDSDDGVTARRRNRVNAKWKKMLQKGVRHYIDTNADTFYRRVRKGIPAEFRWQVWKASLRYEDRYVPNVYHELRGQYSRWTALINIDTPRTFPENEDFGPEKQKALSSILNAYSKLNEDIGYCQGMNYVVGFLLLVADDEEEAFWVFVCLMEYNNLKGFFSRQVPFAAALPGRL
mmetsp:Transcript_135023/g.305662  ORF Transcript_135023/g.305662 Transcript_135023/m.305662 type:complete len:200 (+) Transcript_135023:71-670(+)